MTRRSPDDQARPLPVRMSLLFALVNVPACVLVCWLGANLFDRTASIDGIALSVGMAAVLLAGLLSALVGNLLLYQMVNCTTASLLRTMQVNADHQARIEAVLQTAADAILTCDETGRLRSVNRAAERMFGFPADELIDRPLTTLLPSKVAGDIASLGTSEHQVLGGTDTIEGRRKDGTRFPVALGVSKFRQAGRAVFTVIVHDLSALEAARRSAESASRAKSAFLINMSHEFRTPLGGIIGLVELLRTSGLTEEQGRQLDLLASSAEALVVMVEQVLDFSRLEAGELQLSRQTYSLRRLVAEVIAPQAPLARSKGLRLTQQVAPGLQDWYVGDPVRLRQVLTHLLSNAIKFTAEGEVQIKVPRSEPRGGKMLLAVEVRDTGIGIPADKLRTIFVPFEQGDSSSTRQHGGMGLGLSIAARLVGLMGGQIAVESTPSQGSTFRVRLVQELADEPPPGEGEPRSPVLLVAGQEPERKALDERIRALGWPVVAVDTAQVALAEYLGAVVQGSPFGLVLLHDSLPDSPVADVLRQLEDYPGNCPAVVLTDGAAPRADGLRRLAAVLPRNPSLVELHQALARKGDEKRKQLEAAALTNRPDPA